MRIVKRAKALAESAFAIALAAALSLAMLPAAAMAAPSDGFEGGGSL